ncbi:MAG: DUF1588 domain-containing protein [Planctomycetales bacterium]|nr:DUF1588 domain-containing protein [Planctomycetales bacterium]
MFSCRPIGFDQCVELRRLSCLPLCFLGLLFPSGATSQDSDELLRERGQAIYLEQCADCHGDRGQGVQEAFDTPLQGDESIGELSTLISETMPEGEPETCVAEEALAVSTYIHYAFYSEAARIRNRPPRIMLAHLTASQMRQSVADLYARFQGLPKVTSEHGLKGLYFDGDRYKQENLKLERIDSGIDFDFGHESPAEGIKPESFYVQWTGSLLPKQTGKYEIIVRSTCSFVFDFGREGREFINNHVQSGDNTEFRRTIQLTTGRAYPFKIEFRQRERKTELPPANIRVSWIPPGEPEQIIPLQNLIPVSSPATYSVQCDLPPDDRSYGFDRGIEVSRQWDESVTNVAIEFAEVVIDELWPNFRRGGRRRGEPREQEVGRERLQQFLEELISTAFRQPLTDELRELYIHKQLAETSDDADAIRRVVLLTLKSPRFLYPTSNSQLSDSRQVANRLALVMFDSLPTDGKLLEQVDRNEFRDEAAVRQYASSQMDDYRLRAKTQQFMHQWMNVDESKEIIKDEQQFPGFSAELVRELKQSLNTFLDDVVWREPGSDFRNLFLADWSYTSPEIIKFYGPNWCKLSTDDGWQRTIATPGERFGVLTHPYILSSLAYHDSTSPIHRGVFVIRYLLGRTLRPPADAFAPLSPDLHPDLTTRQRVALQTSPESCQKCHAKINALGFVLENFDSVGRYRNQERGHSIDPSGQYNTRDGEDIPLNGPADLAEFLVSSRDAHEAFVSRAFQHFVKQPVAAYGKNKLRELTDRFEQNEFNIQKLIVDIVVTASLFEPVVPAEPDIASTVQAILPTSP